MAKKKRTRDTAADFARRSNATSRMRSPERMFAAESREPMVDVPAVRAAVSGRDTSPRPTPRPSRGMKSSPRPTTRPDDLAERAERRKAADAADAAYRASRREAADREMGMKAGGKVKKMAMGGKCRGMGAATRGGNFSRS